MLRRYISRWIGSAADPAPSNLNQVRSDVENNFTLLFHDIKLERFEIPLRSLANRIEERSRKWESPAPPDSRLNLMRRIMWNKLHGRTFVEQRGITVPVLYWTGTCQTPLDTGMLPSRFALKPVNSHSCRGVVLFNGVQNLITGKLFQLSEIPQYMAQTEQMLRLPPSTVWLIEELVSDYDSNYQIPRDFKLFAAGGRTFVLYVADRNSPYDSWTSSWYTRNWTRIADQMTKLLKLGPNYPRPDHLERLLYLSDRLASELGIFIRIDWYLSADGPVFGEFTAYPQRGLHYTQSADRALSQLWGLFPDVPIE